MSWDPTHDSRDAFLACMWAQCAPGSVHGPLPYAGLSLDPLLDGCAAVLLAVLDIGLGLAVADDEASSIALADTLRHRTGAHDAPLCDADFVLVGADTEMGVAERARRGTRHTPEAGATIVYCAAEADLAVEMAGPGLVVATRLTIPLRPIELDSLAIANRDAPCGVDAFVVSRHGVLALPRSITIERTM